MKTVKQIGAALLSIIMTFSLSVPAFAAKSDAITEEDVLAAISNGTATVTTEARPLSSFTDEEIDSDAGLQEIFNALASIPSANSSHSSVITGKVYQSTVQVGGDTIKFRLYPTAELNGADVGTSGGAPISTDLHIYESVMVNGVVNHDWENLIFLKDIKGAMGCGINTLFSGYTEFLEDVHVSSISFSNILAIIATPVSSFDYGTSSAIISALSLISYSGSYRTGSTIGNNVRHIGYSWSSKVKLRASSDCLGFETTMVTHDSTKPRSQSAVAAARWEFDVYFGEASGSPEYSGETITPSFGYLVNV